MTSKVSGPRKNSRLGSARPTANEGSRRRTLGPELAFGGAVFASFAAWGASTVTLPPDPIMPVVATLFLGFAAVLAMFGRRNRDPDSGQVTLCRRRRRPDADRALCRSDDRSGSDGAARRKRAPRELEHDPEKWVPVFGKDHAPPKDQSG